MKKYILLILLVIIIIFSTIFCCILFQEKIQTIDIKASKICNINKLKEYSDYNIYSYCLEEISIITNKEKYNIIDFLDKYNFNKILDLFDMYAVAYDGGSIIYKLSDPSIIKGEAIIIIDCNSKQFNNDNIYIASENNNIGIDICKQNSN